jgi:uroporphyrinogen decarboxylase
VGKRDDFRDALQRRCPAGSVPIWELEFHAFDAVSGRHLILGEEMAALPRTEQPRAVEANVEILLGVAEELRFAGLTVPGAHWEIAPSVPAYYWLPDEARLEQIAALARAKPSDLALVAGCGGVISMPAAGEYEEFCYAMHDSPETVDRRARRMLSEGLERARRLRDSGVEVVFTASDIADNRGPFFSPQQMDRFVLPYLREWARAVREMKLLSILHSDGNLMPCLEAIAGTGVLALQSVDPTAGMDMRTAKQRVGDRLCLCGNVDCGLLLAGTPDAVFEATRELLMACKVDGGVVLGASNAVQPEVPVANYRAMLRAWEQHGAY